MNSNACSELFVWHLFTCILALITVFVCYDAYSPRFPCYSAWGAATRHRQEERKWRVGGPPQWMVNHHAVPALNTQNPAASMMRATMTASSTEGGSSVAADETTTSSVMVKSHDGDEDYLCERNRRLSTPPISSSLLTCQSCGSMSPPPLIMTAATMSPPTARDAVLPRSIPLRVWWFHFTSVFLQVRELLVCPVREWIRAHCEIEDPFYELE